MRLLLVCLLLPLLAPVPSLGAQSTVPLLKTRLLHQPLYLRGRWHEDRLSFDPSGQLLGTSTQVPFTVSAIDIKSVKLSGGGLKLEGNRMAVIFHQDAITRKKLESIEIEIGPPSSGDYSAALDRILTSDLADFVPGLPDFWQAYGRAHFLPVAPSREGEQNAKDHAAPGRQPSDSGSQSELPQAPELKKIGSSVRPPKVISAPPPQFNSYARRLNIDGHVLVYLQVDKEGNSARVRLLRPLGAGLDEAAVTSVSHYKFQPAEQAGVPVSVEMNVDVAFRILP